jgi:Transcriptional regulator
MLARMETPSADRRAAPLPPEDRRREIVAAVIPLLLRRGAAVTSREMAAAAGVAEGTIFRVFPDKASVIVEAIRVSMDPAPAQAALARIPDDAPLEARLHEAVRVLLTWSGPVAALVGVLRTVGPPASPRPPAGPRVVAEATAAIRGALVEVLEPHRDRLRIAPAQAASVLHGLVFAAVHPAGTIGEGLDAAAIVDVLLHGVVAAPGDDRC